MEKGGVDFICKILVIGGSAGSLEVVLNMLQALTPRQFAIIVVLHRKNSSESMLAEVLSERSAIPVKEAEEKEPISNGVVYLAPSDYHLLVEHDRTFSLDYSEKVHFSRPSIDVTFESVASVFGSGVVGMLLSGGNADGVEGLAAIRAKGGICVVQDPGSAEIAFMPEYAMSRIAVDLVLKPGDFAPFINRL